jgi:hypothetical protein
MAVVRIEAEREGGEFMIQDRDHMGQTQMGGDAGDRGRRQASQSHGDSHQQSGGQQGGERKQRKPKLLWVSWFDPATLILVASWILNGPRRHVLPWFFVYSSLAQRSLPGNISLLF